MRIIDADSEDNQLRGRDAETLIRRAGVLLPRQEAEALADRLEGWPAALYLAALSLRNGADSSTVNMPGNWRRSHGANAARTVGSSVIPTSSHSS